MNNNMQPGRDDMAQRGGGRRRRRQDRRMYVLYVHMHWLLHTSRYVWTCMAASDIAITARLSRAQSQEKSEGGLADRIASALIPNRGRRFGSLIGSWLSYQEARVS